MNTISKKVLPLGCKVSYLYPTSTCDSKMVPAGHTRLYGGGPRPGSGAGRGGGGGGTIREAGGQFGVMEAAKENQFFYNKTRQQLADLKKHMYEEVEFHQEQIKRHEEAIKRWSAKAKDLPKHD